MYQVQRLRDVLIFFAMPACALLFQTPVLGANISVIAEGVFSEYSDPQGLLPFPQPEAGSTFTIEFAYASDSIGFGLANLGLYRSSILSMNLTLVGATFGLRDSNEIVITNDYSIRFGSDVQDAWLARTFSDAPTGVLDEALRESHGLVLGTVRPAALQPLPPTMVPPLTSIALVPPPWPAEWDSAVIYYTIARKVTDPIAGGTTFETLAQATANVTGISVIPAPAAIWLFGSALGVMGRLRRRT